MHEPKLPETLSTGILALVSGLSERRINQLVEEGTLPKRKAKGEHEALPALKALFRYASGDDPELARRSALAELRRKEAAADNEEIEREKKLGNLVHADAAFRLWLDGFTRFRVALLNSTELTHRQKQHVVALFQGIKLGGEE